MKSKLQTLVLLIIITVPAFLSLLNSGYFSMHDDQHIVRLFLFDEALRQGHLYPRRVDGLGFGYGYPLFNFYPPFIYFVAEFFHLSGFSLIWSVKMIVITGFILSAVGMYLYLQQLFADKKTSFLGATLYTYFFYHAVVSYVRGALAEFFTIAVIPFVFLAIDIIAKKKNIKSSMLFGMAIAVLILTHPLIAFPSVFYVGFFFLFYLFTQKDTKSRIEFFKYFALGGVMGLGLSAFFWMPSMLEKKYTLVDDILTTELANYKIHFIYPLQLLSSLWGYGGSIAGPNDGMTFQLGKPHIGLFLLTLTLSGGLWMKIRKNKSLLRYGVFFISILMFSIFMTIPASSFIWDNVKFLWYLQFPWRFLTFVCFFISVVGGLSVYLFKFIPLQKIEMIRTIFVVVIMVGTIGIYHKYFVPREVLKVTDAQLTTYEEVAWRISRTSFEFIPKGVKTKKSELNTTIPIIDKHSISRDQYTLMSGKATINQDKNLFQKQLFSIDAETPSVLRLNTFYFPGWTAYLKKDKQLTPIAIRDNNPLKLIMVDLPAGQYELILRFETTTVRQFADMLTIVTIITMLMLVILFDRLKQIVKKGQKKKTL